MNVSSCLSQALREAKRQTEMDLSRRGDCVDSKTQTPKDLRAIMGRKLMPWVTED